MISKCGWSGIRPSKDLDHKVLKPEVIVRAVTEPVKRFEKKTNLLDRKVKMHWQNIEKLMRKYNEQVAVVEKSLAKLVKTILKGFADPIFRFSWSITNWC